MRYYEFILVILILLIILFIVVVWLGLKYDVVGRDNKIKELEEKLKHGRKKVKRKKVQ
jgi:hypothetical protein